jgi:hypothetical protein
VIGLDLPSATPLDIDPILLPALGPALARKVFKSDPRIE